MDKDFITIIGGGIFVSGVVSLVLFYGFSINFGEISPWIQIPVMLSGFGLGVWAVRKKNKRDGNPN